MSVVWRCNKQSRSIGLVGIAMATMGIELDQDRFVLANFLQQIASACDWTWRTKQ